MVSVNVIALNLSPFKEQRIVSNPTIKKVNVKFPSSHETMTPFKMALICIAVCQVQIYNDFGVMTLDLFNSFTITVVTLQRVLFIFTCSCFACLFNVRTSISILALKSTHV